jgi:metal-responsive CopG/Arc/MetJ family transcriptional regulator
MKKTEPKRVTISLPGRLVAKLESVQKKEPVPSSLSRLIVLAVSRVYGGK